MLIPAAATAQHAAHFAQLAQIAADDAFSDVFGGRWRAVFESMFLLPDNDNSHAHSMFLLEAGTIAGLMHGYRADSARLTLDVDERNTIARAAYQGAGFEVIDASKKVAIGGEPWAVLRLAKALDRYAPAMPGGGCKGDSQAETSGASSAPSAARGAGTCIVGSAASSS